MQAAIAGQTPYSGSSATIPGTLQAEDFDIGGEAVAYHDNDAANVGGAYRSEAVDIVVGGSGFIVHNFETGEWLEYTMSVPTSGFYSVSVRASNQAWTPAPSYRIEIEGVGDITGTVTVPNTGSWDTYASVPTTVYLNAGTQVLRIVAVSPYFNFDSINISTASSPTPHSGAPASVPTTLQAENFDSGGEGVGYHDSDATNEFGEYRTTEGVDIAQGGTQYVVKNFAAGEWLRYTISVPTAGFYDISVRASNQSWSNPEWPYWGPRFRIEIEGRGDITGAITVPATTSWDDYESVNAHAAPPPCPSLPPAEDCGVYNDTHNAVYLNAGTQVLRVVAVSPYFNFDSIDITAAPTPSPFTGTPIAVPGTWEAEAFDHGGQDVAYHDNVAGNLGGQYRTGEDVDITTSGTAYVVNNFESGTPDEPNAHGPDGTSDDEWLAYTVQVASSGQYDVAVRASNNTSPAQTQPRFAIEIDGVGVPGSAVVPNTGSWDTFNWVTVSGVWLPAGRHVLKIISRQQYANLDQIRVTAAGPPPAANLLFSSHFESAVTVDTPSDCYDTGCYQVVSGIDNSTGAQWPPPIWQTGGDGRFQVHADAPVGATTVGAYITNSVQSGTGRSGSYGTGSLYSEIERSGCNCGTGGTGPQGGGSTQDPYLIEPEAEPAGIAGDLYLSYWVKYQSDLGTLMGACVPNIPTQWRMLSEWKTRGDYRVDLSVMRDRDPNASADPCFTGPLYWVVLGDAYGNCNLYLASNQCEQNTSLLAAPEKNVWLEKNRLVPVPVGQWFKLEVFLHRSGGVDGRVWMAADGQVIVDHRGPNIGVYDTRINRIMLTQLYTSTSYPAFQWVDDIQMWNGFPSLSSGPYFDPPYAPH